MDERGADGKIDARKSAPRRRQTTVVCIGSPRAVVEACNGAFFMVLYLPCGNHVDFCTTHKCR